MTAERFDEAILAIGRVPAVRTTTYDRIAFRDAFAVSNGPRSRSA